MNRVTSRFKIAVIFKKMKSLPILIRNKSILTSYISIPAILSVACRPMPMIRYSVIFWVEMQFTPPWLVKPGYWWVTGITTLFTFPWACRRVSVNRSTLKAGCGAACWPPPGKDYLKTSPKHRNVVGRSGDAGVLVFH